ncbi:hypothetical protein ABT288_45975 [Streptomyces sp. NPDC001093]|uniref:hypothetical protein n=1 Tax=Streptomyces TaxID=1883 RepID=UPI00332BFD84
MGAKPSAAAYTADTEPTSSAGEATSTSGRFGMPHALVIIACIVTAAILAELGMDVRNVLALLAGAAGIGAAVVVAVGTGGRRAGRIGRLVRAYLSAGN